jgi:hypothetical protein
MAIMLIGPQSNGLLWGTYLKCLVYATSAHDVGLQQHMENACETIKREGRDFFTFMTVCEEMGGQHIEHLLL